MISAYQSAFVYSTFITDDIVFASYERAHYVHNKRDGDEGVMALILELGKAYDRMK